MSTQQKVGLRLTQFSKPSLVLAVVAFALAVIGLYRLWERQASPDPACGWVIISAFAFASLALVRPIFSLAKEGHRAVRAVCWWATLLLLIFLLCSYSAYFLFFGMVATPANSAADKILNLPPVVAAVWAASMGWYVHHQATMKNQRTANAFATVMQTRTNAEFLNHLRRVQIHFPTGGNNLSEASTYFSTTSIKTAVQSLREARLTGNDGEIYAARQGLRIATAVDSTKHLLNFYEFVAVGIKFGDLDENMIYETISVSITSLYQRAAPLREYFAREDGANQVLAFEHLDELVSRWQARLNTEEAIARNKRAPL